MVELLKFASQWASHLPSNTAFQYYPPISYWGASRDEPLGYKQRCNSNSSLLSRLSTHITHLPYKPIKILSLYLEIKRTFGFK